MIQVIKIVCDNLDEVINKVNSIGIDYDYFKGYKLINTDCKYVVLLEFDVPKIRQVLDLSIIRLGRKKEPRYIYTHRYDISFYDKNKETFMTSLSQN